MRASPLKLLILVVMSILGLTASSIVLYLYNTLHQLPPYCSTTQTFWGIALNCGVVLGSSYNSIFGLNLDVLAVTYFIVNLALIFMVAFGSDRLYDR
ncbi:MAG: vitamin K epoxide reductase family protein, partial [Nitrososphaerales archaeon]